MPTSGRPTNWALLQMTRGSSGPAVNPFQKTGKIGETAPSASAIAEEFAGLRLISSVAITAIEAASRIDRAATATTHLRGSTKAPDGGSAVPASPLAS